MRPSTVTARAANPCRATSAPASSGIDRSGTPAPVTDNRPTVVPRITGAGSGEAYSIITFALFRHPRGIVTTRSRPSRPPKINGTVVPAGGTFDFWKVVGDLHKLPGEGPGNAIEGGKITVIASDDLTFKGTALARGGSLGGDGGWIETSGHRTVDFAGATIDASAPSGLGGEWLIDPYDLTVDSAAATSIMTSLNSGTSVTLAARCLARLMCGLRGHSGIHQRSGSVLHSRHSP